MYGNNLVPNNLEIDKEIISIYTMDLGFQFILGGRLWYEIGLKK